MKTFLETDKQVPQYTKLWNASRPKPRLNQFIASGNGTFIDYLGLTQVDFANTIAKYKLDNIKAYSLLTQIFEKWVKENLGTAKIAELSSILQELMFVNLSRL